MKVPQLEKKPELKSCHNTTWEDNYSWIHQDNILEVLKDSSKLLPDVRKYLEEENTFTEHNLKDTKKYQKILFDEDTINIALIKQAENEGIKPYIQTDPIYLMKSQKNKIELNGVRAAHLRDSTAVIKFMSQYTTAY